jgi:hypothetical protein
MKNSFNSEKAVEVRPEESRPPALVRRGRNLTRRLSHFYSLGKQKDFALARAGANFLQRAIHQGVFILHGSRHLI